MNLNPCQEIMIDVTNYCNLSCPLCPNSDIRKKTNITPKQISFDKFKAFVDTLKTFPDLFVFGNKCEPLLNNAVFDMVKYVNSKSSCRTVMFTNFNLADKFKIEDIFSSEIEHFIIGLDGIDQISYAEYRTGGNFDRVINAIKKIQTYKKTHNLQFPILSIMFIVFKHNEHLREKAKIFFESLDVHVDFKRTDLYDGYENWLPEKFTKNIIINEKESEQTSSFCILPWRKATIDVDGNVFPCCADEALEFKFGNIFEKSFDKIWEGKELNNLRLFLRNEIKNIKVPCINCPVYKNNGYTDVANI
ncbi:MAG: radical SAM protein [Endomicrobiaceae bacterium]|nr:radical SAM protein [Endomicrobiaceae bacterium]